jgi:murein DD-endopeptidase MepM/ murein hydrolase activator NlpD
VLLMPMLCGAVIVVLYVTLIGMLIPQLPEWAQPCAYAWMQDMPINSECAIEGAMVSVVAFAGKVGWDDYVGEDGVVYGLPMGAISHWGKLYDRPLLGCVFHDPAYMDHTGSDFPMDTATPIQTTLSGKVVWAGDNGPWGNLVVVQNGDYQAWFAHLDQIEVVEDQIISRGEVVGLSGDTGNSTGPHLHYGIKHLAGPGAYEWLNPEQFFSADNYIKTPCSD